MVLSVSVDLRIPEIPFGLLSDRIGRKIMIVAGLAPFGVGSAVAMSVYSSLQFLSVFIGGLLAAKRAQSQRRSVWADDLRSPR